MTDDLTNPDILAALEIAEVEWWQSWADGFDRHRLHTGPDSIDTEVWTGRDWRLVGTATPADLDHALKEWLLWLGKRTLHTILLTLRGGKARCTLNVDDRLVDEFGESPLLAVAAAVVKVGKPEETADATL